MRIVRSQSSCRTVREVRNRTTLPDKRSLLLPGGKLCGDQGLGCGLFRARFEPGDLAGALLFVAQTGVNKVLVPERLSQQRPTNVRFGGQDPQMQEGKPAAPGALE